MRSNYRPYRVDSTDIVPETCPLVDEEAERLFVEVESRAREIVTNSDELSDLLADIKPLIVQLTNFSKKQNSRLRTALDDLLGDKLELEGRLSAVEHESEDLKHELEDLKRDYQHLENELDAVTRS